MNLESQRSTSQLELLKTSLSTSYEKVLTLRKQIETVTFQDWEDLFIELEKEPSKLVTNSLKVRNKVEMMFKNRTGIPDLHRGMAWIWMSPIGQLQNETGRGFYQVLFALFYLKSLIFFFFFFLFEIAFASKGI